MDAMAFELFDDAPAAKPAISFEMDSAFQGEEALAKILSAEQAGRPYSLAFMDVRMPPGWDGVETISHIWKEYPHIQIVICTAYSDYSWDQILTKLGETDSLVILKKPFDQVEVLQLAHTLTKKWLLSRQANRRLASLDEMVQQRTQELSEANRHLEHEIQRRSLTEAALRESEERFHLAFESVPIALSIRRLDTKRYLDVNYCFAQLCGHPKDALLGKTPDELNLFAAPEAHRRLLQSLSEGRRVEQASLDIRRKDGQLRHTVISIELLRLGEHTCVLAALQDVTGQKELEAQLRQAQKMEAVGQLAAGVAHDFNNLLTVIHGYASLQLVKHNLETEVARAFTQVKLASERAAALTRQLLAFSRKQVVQRKPINLLATLGKMQAMLSRVLGEGIRLEVQGPEGLPLIHADESNLEQVIMNLSVNARDAMPHGGKLSLRARQASITPAQVAGHPDKHPGEYVSLEVSDTGCGMDAATLGRIFEPFFTTKPIGRGTGLGLSTVYGIVKQHEGWIDVESQPGLGSTFRVFLPVAQGLPDSEPNSLPAPARVQPADTQGAILVVEDQADVRDYMCEVLSQNHFQVIAADSGADALSKWKNLPGKVSLLLTDLVMPDGVSGLMLAHRLLGLEPGLKVVYTSGYNPDAVASGNSLSEGVNFLPKPFNQDQLLETVRAALSAQSPPPRPFGADPHTLAAEPACASN